MVTPHHPVPGKPARISMEYQELSGEPSRNDIFINMQSPINIIGLIYCLIWLIISGVLTIIISSLKHQI